MRRRRRCSVRCRTQRFGPSASRWSRRSAQCCTHGRTLCRIQGKTSFNSYWASSVLNASSGTYDSIGTGDVCCVCQRKSLRGPFIRSTNCGWRIQCETSPELRLCAAVHILDCFTLDANGRCRSAQVGEHCAVSRHKSTVAASALQRVSRICVQNANYWVGWGRNGCPGYSLIAGASHVE